ncbi:hypothetical protein [Massilia sp. Se16.2.3]|uniref:hypothetical protein n=1 Tax=Massilia sp. Se16.2.3 TaxID=2709303 RepID=UPI0016016A32|nr:hypothetical protein [Massilia sp. Se16.2.3]QNB00557.1 hypothetical protein G4G31_20035 [Massilia sp. Se16.2.3]
MWAIQQDGARRALLRRQRVERGNLGSLDAERKAAASGGGGGHHRTSPPGSLARTPSAGAASGGHR